MYNDEVKPPIEHGIQAGAAAHRKPPWLRVGLTSPSGERPDMTAVRAVLSEHRLSTVCEGSGCPNLFECYARGTATFLILGDRCTRACAFCRVGSSTSATPGSISDTLSRADEPQRVASAVAALRLKHVVITSVTRDDLPDGGAAVFAGTVAAIRDSAPTTSVELLVPDMGGDDYALSVVFDSRPDVLGHNVETVPRLYPAVRRRASFDRSLNVLSAARSQLPPSSKVKSGLMVGLGEEPHEVLETAEALREAGCESITVGQYLQPSRTHIPVSRYWAPEEFSSLADSLGSMGFTRVVCEPLARSSYHAGPR